MLIGDHKQLPPVYKEIKVEEANNSLFKRLLNAGFPMNFLSIQYRMHPDIMKISNDLCYDGKIKNGFNVL